MEQSPSTNLPTSETLANVPLTTYIVQHNAVVLSSDSSGRTTVYLAARNESRDILSLKLPAGEADGSPNTIGRLPQDSANTEYRIELVRTLVENGSEVEVEVNRDDQWKAIAITSDEDYIMVGQMLLGLDVTLEPKELWTLLNATSAGGQIDVIKFLIDQGANPTAGDERMWTSLHTASSFGHVKIVELLVQHGASCIAVAEGDWTPLHLAANHGHLEVVRLLLEKGVNVNATNEIGATPLSLASNSGHVGVVELLIANCVDMEATDRFGRTPLILASSKGHFDVVKLLIEKGACMTSADDDGWTAMATSSSNGHLEVVQLFLDNGAHVVTTEDDIENQDGGVALQTATINGHIPVIRLLLDHGIDVEAVDEDGNTSLHLAASSGNLPVIQLLLDYRASPNVLGSNARTSLHAAVESGNKNAVQLILNAKANISLLDQGKHSALHRAAEEGHISVFRRLLEAHEEQQVDFMGRCNASLNVLDKASKSGHDSIVQLLIEKGVDIASEHDGSTALHLAAMHGRVNAVTLLLSHNADPLRLDYYGRSSLDWASLNEPTFNAMLPFIGEYKATDPAISKIILAKTITFIATRILNDEANDWYKLGKCLIYANNLEAARTAFAREAVASLDDDDPSYGQDRCDACSQDLTISGGRFVCQQCPEVDMCSSCMDHYRNGHGLRVCHMHEFLEIGSLQKNDTDESDKDWLKGLISFYGTD